MRYSDGLSLVHAASDLPGGALWGPCESSVPRPFVLSEALPPHSGTVRHVAACEEQPVSREEDAISSGCGESFQLQEKGRAD